MITTETIIAPQGVNKYDSVPGDCLRSTQTASNPWGSTSIEVGSTIERAPLIKGNHVDALPYWSRRIELNNPKWDFNYSIKDIAPAYYKCEYSDTKDYPTMDGRIFGSVGVSDLRTHSFSSRDIQLVRTLADTKARADLRKGLMNIPILIRERVQTVESAKRAVGDMMRVVETVQSRDLRAWKKLKSARSRRAFAQAAASRHLEIVFGWLPLIGEIEGAMDLAGEFQRDFVIGRGRHTITGGKQTVRTVNDRAWVLNIHTTTTKWSTYGVRTNLRAEVTSEFGRGAQKLGFNPLYSLYDMTPFSFITGWFSNFNHVIQSLDPLIGVKFRTGSRSIRNSSRVRKTIAPSQSRYFRPDLHVMKYSGYGECHGSMIHDNREVLTSEPDIDFVLYNNFSPFTVFAGASLYLQRRLKPIEKLLRVKKFRYRSKTPIDLPPVRYKPANRVKNS